MTPENMDTEKLTTLMRVRLPEDRVNTPTCPDEHEIAAFCSGTLASTETERILVHLADCETCAAHLALVSRLHDTESVTPTPELTLARARRLTRHGRSQRVRRFSGWAAAAAVVLAVFFVVDSQREQGPAWAPGAEGIQSQPTIRNRSLVASPPQVLAPVSGARVNIHEFVFQWTEIPGSLYYDIHIVSKMGDLVMKDRVTGTHWQAPASLTVEPGADYFVRIDAFLSDAKTVSSEHVSFKAGEVP